MEHSFLFTPDEVLKHFGVTEETGLTHDGVLKSRAKNGANGELLPVVKMSKGAQLTASIHQL